MVLVIQQCKITDDSNNLMTKEGQYYIMEFNDYVHPLSAQQILEGKQNIAEENKRKLMERRGE